MGKQISKSFWDKFDNELYKEIVEGRRDDVLQIRIKSDKKVEFKDNVEFKGGMTNVLNAFIDELNRREKTKND